MIDPDKTYRTRDGRDVRIYAVDGGDVRPVHGAWKNPDVGWIMDSWHLHGYHRQTNDTPLDLIEVKPRIKREVWVNVYPKCSSIHHSKYEADAVSALHRIACVKLTIDCEEGEGL